MTGQGNGQGGREHGQKADQLPGYRRIDDPAARRHVAAVWGIPESRPARSGQVGVRADRVVRASPAASARCWSSDRTRSSRRRMRRTSPSGSSASTFWPSPISSCRRRRTWPTWCCPRRSGRRRRARSPISKGASSAAGARSIRRRQVRTDIDILCALARALGKIAVLLVRGSAGGVRGAAARRARGGPADYSGITYERIDAKDGVFWPCPSEDHPGTPRLFADAFPTPTGRARFHAVEHQRPGRGARRAAFRCISRPAACWRTTSRERRRGASPQLMRAAPEPLAEMHPQQAKRHGLDRRRAGDPSNAARVGAIHQSRSRRTSVRTRSSFRFTGPASRLPTA